MTTTQILAGIVVLIILTFSIAVLIFRAAAGTGRFVRLYILVDPNGDFVCAKDRKTLNHLADQWPLDHPTTLRTVCLEVPEGPEKKP